MDIQSDLLEIIFDHLWELSWKEILELSEESDVHFTTLYNWRNGNTTGPRISTLARVADCIGYDLVAVER